MKRKAKKAASTKTKTTQDGQPVCRIVGPGEPVGIAATSTVKPHWSACPKCGQSKLSITGYTPVCSHTVGRVAGHVQKYMRCRECETRYTAMQPD